MPTVAVGIHPARLEFDYRDEPKWVRRRGIVERGTTKDPDAYSGDRRRSKRRNYLTQTAEKPGVPKSVLCTASGI